MSFTNLGLAPALCAPLGRQGYHEPTPVQTAAIPVVLGGGDLVARAQTGTGNTAAFGLPMIHRLHLQHAGRNLQNPRGLVLVPTRELAVQVQRALATYGAPLRYRVAAVFGGVSMHAQIQELRRGTDIVVATPGRLIDHIQRRTIDLSSIQILVLDEADRMLDMGFLPPLRRVLAALPRQRQTLLYSATVPREVEQLSTQFTRDAARVDVSSGDVVATTVTHQLYPVAFDRKRALLSHVLNDDRSRQVLVFCKTKRGADRVGDHLEAEGRNVGVIHGAKSQGSRTRSLADFKAGRVNVLVATDLAARGLDIAQLPLVVNYDLPLVPEDYVHRVGRTGRAGAAGRAISFVTAEDRGLVGSIQRLLPSPLEHVAIDGFQATAGGASGIGRPQHAARPLPPGTRSYPRSLRNARMDIRTISANAPMSHEHGRPTR
jgi:ATP-dependent RNA helicase RhlE